MTAERFARAFAFAETIREYGGRLSLSEHGEVICDVRDMPFVDAFGEAALRCVFHQMHDDLAEVLRHERQDAAPH